MRLWVLSDWHTETRLAFDPPRPEAFDVLVVAGDVSNSIEESIEMVAVIAGGQPAIFVPGNHEWMGDGRTYAEKRAAAIAKVGMHGVTFLDAAAIDIDDEQGNRVRFAGATLWEIGHSRFQESVLALESFSADVIVTHFPPTPLLLTRLLPVGGVWIQGHHHGYADMTLDGRRVLRNAAGYANEPSDGLPAIPNLTIEIGGGSTK